MIENIPHTGGLGFKRFMARRLAQRTGQMMSHAEDIDKARRRIDRAGDEVPCASEIEISDGQIAGQSALFFQPKNPRPGTLLYFHGGGFFAGSARSHKALVSWISKAFNMAAISANYRLAPEHVCPAGIEDCTAVLRYVTQACEAPLIVSGDSNGAGIALAAVLRHRNAGLRTPAALYLMSPWVDATLSANSIKTVKNDPMIQAYGVQEAIDMYVGAEDPNSIDASPLFASLRGLPPVLIQFGQNDLLRDDGVRLAERLKTVDVECRAEQWQGMFHNFQLYRPLIKEADHAIKSAANWCSQHI
jgi:acetyl esterase/lipase